MPAMTAQTQCLPHGRTKLWLIPMTDVEAARAEFGVTLADAKAFVLQTCCTECGVEACSAQPCTGCGAPCCACVVHPHDDGLWFCEDCRPAACWCRYCTD